MQKNIIFLCSKSLLKEGLPFCFVLFLLVTSVSNSYAQNQTSDFPKYINTGNSSQDALNYQKAKEEWISKNPEEYKNMVAKSNPQQHDVQPTVISTEKFNAMPADKQAIIKANPDRYIIGETDTHPIIKISATEFKKMSATKQAVIKANPNLYKIED